MPLRAKITNPAFSTSARRQAFAEGEELKSLAYPKEEPGDEPDDVLFSSVYGVRTIELNRPKKLNSLNGSMARKILPRLKEWEKSQMANAIIIAGAGPKAFCAGGDVAALAAQNKKSLEAGNEKGIQASAAYFDLEYRLDHTIATLSKPYIAYMDGITMGGGVGLSVHAPFRLATERTMFAMPETTIGFFPDVGASFFLPRLDGAIGTYLALTSDRLHGVDVFWSGIATHYIESTSLAPLTQRLAELNFNDHLPYEQRLEKIASTIEEYSTGLPKDKPALLSGDLRRVIDRCFAPQQVEEIISRLEEEAQGATSPEIARWAEKTRATILERSPTSVKVTRGLLQLGRGWTIDQAFVREAALAEKFMKHPDFNEGVSAKLIDKPARTPAWQPAELGGISDEAVEEMLSSNRNLKLVGGERSDVDFAEYPFQMGLPSEVAIRQTIEKTQFESIGDVVKDFVKRTSGKTGVAEKVQEVVDRCAEIKDGVVTWTEPGLGLVAREKKNWDARNKV